MEVVGVYFSSSGEYRSGFDPPICHHLMFILFHPLLLISISTISCLLLIHLIVMLLGPFVVN